MPFCLCKQLQPFVNMQVALQVLKLFRSRSGLLNLKNRFKIMIAFNVSTGCYGLQDAYFLIQRSVEFYNCCRKRNSINKKQYLILCKQVLVDNLLSRMLTRFKARAGRHTTWVFAILRQECVTKKRIRKYLFHNLYRWWQSACRARLIAGVCKPPRGALFKRQGIERLV